MVAVSCGYFRLRGKDRFWVLLVYQVPMRHIQAILSRVAWINSDRLLSGHIDLVRVFRSIGKDIFGVNNQRRMA